jgi:hypothetical protein
MTSQIADIARFPQERVAESAESAEIWLRQKSEPARWYLRFTIYRDLGSKRSLRKAIDTDSGPGQATIGNEKQHDRAVKSLSVPGAWSRASKLWKWQERAEAWDLAMLVKQGKRYQLDVGECEYASRVTRIRALNNLLMHEISLVEKNPDIEIHMDLVRLVQSLLKQIADESRLFDGIDQTELDGRVADYLLEKARKARLETFIADFSKQQSNHSHEGSEKQRKTAKKTDTPTHRHP